MLSYYEFMQQFIEDDSALGDLARELDLDETFPVKSKDCHKILNHIKKDNPSFNCLEIFRKSSTLYAKYKTKCNSSKYQNKEG